jgi:NADH pyrophosphatase NudC (nudix superfamily)
VGDVGLGVTRGRSCPFCSGRLVADRVGAVAVLVCHALRCLGYDQTAPTVLIVLDGDLVRRRDLERLLAQRLEREQKIES